MLSTYLMVQRADGSKKEKDISIGDAMRVFPQEQMDKRVFTKMSNVFRGVATNHQHGT